MLETQWKKSYVCVYFIVVFVRLMCFVRPNANSPDDFAPSTISCKMAIPGQILSHLFSWHSLEILSLFRGQREKRIDLVLRQPQHPADLAIRGTEFVAEFPGEIKSLRFGQVLNR